MMPISNDHVSLKPVTDFDGPELEFDFPGLSIGVAEYEEGPTGCTVFSFDRTVACTADIRGGGHATIYSTELSRVQAICLAGGSQLGLEAASGVASELLARRNYSTFWDDIPLVAGAIIYDYGFRENAIFPDKSLGRAALAAARPGRFPTGPRGAGRSATVGKGLRPRCAGENSGQGAAFRDIGPTKIAVFVVVNAFGAIVDRQGRVVRGHLDVETGARVPYIEGIEQRLAEAAPGASMGNTTLTVVVTNQQFSAPRGPDWALRQFARMVHSSMSRAIQPFHTMYDGDVLYAATTGEVANPALDDTALSAVAAELAWDAVLGCY